VDEQNRAAARFQPDLDIRTDEYRAVHRSVEDLPIDDRPIRGRGVIVMQVEIVFITKIGGALTKRIQLDENGCLKSDGTECVMSRGIAQRAPIAGVERLAHLIQSLGSDQAITLGTLRAGLPHEVTIATRRVSTRITTGAHRADD
jgi:hypothetical protein